MWSTDRLHAAKAKHRAIAPAETPQTAFRAKKSRCQTHRLRQRDFLLASTVFFLDFFFHFLISLVGKVDQIIGKLFFRLRG